MSATYVPLEVRQSIANRARHRCEYCHTQEVIVGMPLEIEHIMPEIAGGSSDETNSASPARVVIVTRGGKRTRLMLKQ